MLYNLDHTVMQYCNGTHWVSMDASRAGKGGGDIPADPTDCIDRAPISLVWDASASRIVGMCMDTTPDTFGFTDLTEQPLDMLVTSNIVQIRGITGAAPIQIGGDGNPAYRICSESNCSAIVQDWSINSGTISNNQFIQIRLTTASQLSTQRNATLRIGQTSTQWNVANAAATIYVLDNVGSGPDLAIVKIPSATPVTTFRSYDTICRQFGLRAYVTTDTSTTCFRIAGYPAHALSCNMGGGLSSGYKFTGAIPAISRVYWITTGDSPANENSTVRFEWNAVGPCASGTLVGSCGTGTAGMQHAKNPIYSSNYGLGNITFSAGEYITCSM